ncbi:MAG: hypothetical protein J0H85_08175 [Sediminibacterium magnilacihabitans]|jgi:uncharacterized low-complexity protein|nr:hypothetical protein [Sediminibacterium magnilacihabitans]PQV60709.1 hypothetical protein CLV53_106145 [Sediminibacterium magnilacihabitans]
MEKKRNIVAGSILTGAMIAVSGIAANAAGTFHYNNMGSGEAVRGNLLSRTAVSRSLELKCGEKGKADSTMGKKGKDGKCGEGKCGSHKKDGKKADKTKDKSGKTKSGM